MLWKNQQTSGILHKVFLFQAVQSTSLEALVASQMETFHLKVHIVPNL